MKKEQFPLGWEVLTDKTKKIFFVLGTAKVDDRVHNAAVKLTDSGYRVVDHTPLVETFPTKEKLLEYFKNAGYKYIEQSWQSYYGIY